MSPVLAELTKSLPAAQDFICVKTFPPSMQQLKLVDIIDTPGFIDGDIFHPFDLISALEHLGAEVDVVLVLLDPHSKGLLPLGQDVCQNLWKNLGPKKIKFCISKMDRLRSLRDVVKVSSQITQSLTARLGAHHALDFIPFYIEGAEDGSYIHHSGEEPEPSESNRIKDVVETIRTSMEGKVQEDLQIVRKDCRNIRCFAEKILKSNEADKSYNGDM